MAPSPLELGSSKAGALPVGMAEAAKDGWGVVRTAVEATTTAPVERRERRLIAKRAVSGGEIRPGDVLRGDRTKVGLM